jgi:hypothetical protein
MSQIILLLLYLAGLLILPFLVIFLFSFLLFLFKEFLIEPLAAALMGRNMQQQPHWDTTAGMIDSRVILKKRRWYYLGHWRRKWINDSLLYREFPTWYAHVEIIYLVDNKSYFLRPPFSFMDELLSVFEDKAADMVAKYPSGNRIDVNYDPYKPQHAVLKES